MKIKFINLPKDYEKGTQILCKRMKCEDLDVTIRFEKADVMETGFKNGEGYIKCAEKHHFFRLLGLFVQNYKGEEFSVTEAAGFKTLSIMLDLSFEGVMTVKSIFDFIEIMSLMGYNQLHLYMEDMFEIKELPLFGHYRGRFTQEELKAIDDYAFDFGIEAIPSIQALGHMEHFLKWPQNGKYAENSNVLLPDSEDTYELIELILKNASAPFRSRRIMLGLDETHGLGLGKYLKTHEYTDSLEILVKHIQRVSKIAVGLGLKPIMAFDMLMCFSSKTYSKYDRDVVIKPEIANAIPKEMQILYWNYEDLTAEEVMIDKLAGIGTGELFFQGGVWTWAGALPDNKYSSMHNEIAIPTCKRKGVKEVMLSVWAYSSVLYQTAYLEMARYGELTYNDTSANLKERFEFITGASYDAFWRMSDLHALYSEGEKDYDALPYRERFAGNKIMWQDIMLGVFDDFLMNEPRAEHYARGAEFYAELVKKNDSWADFYRFCLAVFEFMSAKSEVGEKLYRAYQDGDRATLEYLAKDVLPRLLQKTKDMHFYHNLHKDTYLKPFGSERMDHQYGGIEARCETAIRRLNGYLDGRFERLEELEQDRLPHPVYAWSGGFGYVAFR